MLAWCVLKGMWLLVVRRLVVRGVRLLSFNGPCCCKYRETWTDEEYIQAGYQKRVWDSQTTEIWEWPLGKCSSSFEADACSACEMGLYDLVAGDVTGRTWWLKGALLVLKWVLGCFSFLFGAGGASQKVLELLSYFEDHGNLHRFSGFWYILANTDEACVPWLKCMPWKWDERLWFWYNQIFCLDLSVVCTAFLSLTWQTQNWQLFL